MPKPAPENINLSAGSSGGSKYIKPQLLSNYIKLLKNSKIVHSLAATRADKYFSSFSKIRKPGSSGSPTAMDCEMSVGLQNSITADLSWW